MVKIKYLQPQREGPEGAKDPCFPLTPYIEGSEGSDVVKRRTTLLPASKRETPLELSLLTASHYHAHSHRRHL